MTDDQRRHLAESRSKVFKALGHRSRILMVSYLANQDATAGELVKLVGADASTVSKHLAILKSAGILRDKKKSNNVLYGLKCPCIMEFIHCIDDVIFTESEGDLACVIPGVRIIGDGPKTIPSITLSVEKDPPDADKRPPEPR